METGFASPTSEEVGHPTPPKRWATRTRVPDVPTFRCGLSAMNEKASIALIGLRGAGKSSVGRELATLLGGAYVDTDELIVREAACSIAEIFSREGESGFRLRERRVIASVVINPPAVISVGGGAVLDADNVEALLGVATIVWLDAPTGVLWTRVSNDPTSPGTRPALTDLDGERELERLTASRRPLYARAADLVIDASLGSPVEIARRITDRLAAR